MAVNTALVAASTFCNLTTCSERKCKSMVSASARLKLVLQSYAEFGLKAGTKYVNICHIFLKKEFILGNVSSKLVCKKQWTKTLHLYVSPRWRFSFLIIDRFLFFFFFNFDGNSTVIDCRANFLWEIHFVNYIYIYKNIQTNKQTTVFR